MASTDRHAPAPSNVSDVPAEQPGATDAAGPTAEAPHKSFRKQFVRRGAAVRMPADAAERQGRVTTLAWTAFGGRDDALSFLNTLHPELGGRPIDLAVADASGLAAVEAVIRAHAERNRT